MNGMAVKDLKNVHMIERFLIESLIEYLNARKLKQCVRNVESILHYKILKRMTARNRYAKEN